MADEVGRRESMLQAKRMLKEALYKILSQEPVLRYWRKTSLSNKIIVLAYHEIAHDVDEIEAWTVVRKSSFIRQMEYLSSHFEIISLEEAMSRMENLSHITSPAAVVTFDDGYRGNKTVLLQVIESMNIPVTIFVATRAVQEQSLYWYDRVIMGLQGKRTIKINLKRHMLGFYEINKYSGAKNWSEIERLLKDLKSLDPPRREKVVREILEEVNISKKECSYIIAPLSINELQKLAISPLVTIGAHSHCHNILSQISGDGIVKSIKTSKELLESWICRRVDYFSYPNGNYNDNIIKILRESCFKCSFTLLRKPWERGDSIFTIPRMGIGRYDSLEYFKLKVSGGFN